ncbi:hypothetical protein C8Q73DRAFT_394113 [Cubamyces lactineus]|nr:hypothetical protein C8Q73DRAFT_394113 [Cubamyces lactineus]
MFSRCCCCDCALLLLMPLPPFTTIPLPIHPRTPTPSTHTYPLLSPSALCSLCSPFAIAATATRLLFAHAQHMSGRRQGLIATRSTSGSCSFSRRAFVSVSSGPRCLLHVFIPFTVCSSVVSRNKSASLFPLSFTRQYRPFDVKVDKGLVPCHPAKTSRSKA